MAVITLQTIGAGYPAQRIAARLKAAAVEMRALIDCYVSYRMQTSASQAERIGKSAAEIAQATSSSALPAQPQNLSTVDTDDESGGALQQLDPGTISDAIPAFFIGRNRDGLWVARYAKGDLGGIFLFRDSAIAFARKHSGSTGCATIFPTERFELDVANSGNPLAPFIGRSLRLASHVWRRSPP